ncbi:bifunctional diguanylate cyclase/phosphodiesterase [Paenibacillus sp. GSMTC-2017]|uniref:putative bifunctional diguanylate cyclase/phosphodiesterase n=1 Tax=Paenibacillus sp. GSMTC-2017 TaxID=2794350 RepID=UPI0018D8A3C7|nr:bifunctional diguanylate cyclase/phosphodiesterase [Paenibacillus sp. GSMTC-2017]MBH5318674.1 bifunctional diguanylate cyclase/phosphodiesterase [Paenibacillus sp. GSMTC-2017]
MGGAIDLPGRSEAFIQMEIAINNARVSGRRLLVALLDIDRFYCINETKGTDFGNYALNIIYKRLTDAESAISKICSHTVCRFGGNAFLVIVEVEQEELNDWKMVEAIKYAVTQPIDDDGTELYLTASIGASLFPQDGHTSELLICHTESALHQSKGQGGNQVLFYNAEDTERMNRRTTIEAALRPALFLRQFHLSYQPIYRLSDGRLRGYEALIRWNHPELGAITPNEFIPIAEQNGLIIPIGEWVLREACKMLAGITKYSLSEMTMSINISPIQLMDPSFTHTVLNVIKEKGLQPYSIELEITENILSYSSETSISTLSRLRAEGIRISLDDFGTGYSSFSNLKQLPIHCLKIDKSFIKKMDLHSADRHIVEAIIGLVQKLGLEVIAEGVEYEEQYHLLREWGCNYVQGYLLGKPWEPTLIDMTMLRNNNKSQSIQTSEDEMALKAIK